MSLSLKHKIAVNLIDLISKTWRIQILGEKPARSGIVAFWHGQMLPGWKALADVKPYAIVSKSKDGAVLSALLEKWGLNLLRGSSSKGGKEVLQQIGELAKNNLVLMTPDGPRGPNKKMKAGAVIASQRSGSPLYLCGIVIKNKRIFKKSWDNFQFPLPFSKIIISYSNPLYIENFENRNLTENIIKETEKQLIEMNEHIFRNVEKR